MRIREWKLQIAAYGLFGLALICVSRGESGARLQQERASEAQSEQLIRSLEGPDLFRAYCASCHGADGKGNGPVAPALKATVPDLTLIANNNGGNFPAARVRRVIMGEGIIASHGSREMPVWGPIFHQIEWDVDRGNIRLENLVKYLESIQTLHPSEEKRVDKLSAETVPSGEKLYKQNCAACHGNDLKGNGPAPPPFKDVPPDLTTLARRHGGKFPDKYVSDVLRNGVVIPAHGPPEMPTWGADFRARDQLDSTQLTLRITNLTNYIKSLQAK
jgi:mono/diheme cytochrome c family protein